MTQSYTTELCVNADVEINVLDYVAVRQRTSRSAYSDVRRRTQCEHCLTAVQCLTLTAVSGMIKKSSILKLSKLFLLLYVVLYNKSNYCYVLVMDSKGVLCDANSAATKSTENKCQLGLLQMPPEILEHILTYLSFDEISVCRQVLNPQMLSA